MVDTSTDTSVTKVSSPHSPKGKLGQKYLASGKRVSMRLWEGISDAMKTQEETARDYETVGYCISGRASLHLAGQLLTIEPGDSWVVPAGAPHYYDSMENFTAVEATSPPAQVHARDEHQAESRH